MVQFRWPVKLTLFLSSYVPLFLILAVELGSWSPRLRVHLRTLALDVEATWSWIGVSFVLLSLLLVAALVFVLRYHSGHRTERKRCDHFQQRNELLASYLLAYVFVFVGLDFANADDVFIFLLFFGMLAVLQMNSEMLHVNPLLGLGGYKVYEVESEDRTLLVISRGDIRESIEIPESERGSGEPEYRNIEVISLGPSTYLAATNDD